MPPSRPVPDAPGRPGSGPPAPVEADARGIVAPEAMRRVVTLNRYPVGEALAGVVDWFWAVTWALPPGVVHTQQVLTHPGGNVSVGHGEAGPDGVPGPPETALYGVATRLSSRRLGGSGWTVAALLTPGGLGALQPGPATRLTDRVVRPDPDGRVVPGLDGAALLAEVASTGAGGPDRRTEPERVAVLRRRLAELVEGADPDRVAAAREVAAVARLAATDRGIRRLDQLATAAGVTPRTLQRMFAEHAGVSPTWVLRRYRLLEAAEQARHGTAVTWARVAAQLGYSDQAHLVREFRSHLGTTPAAYAATLTPAPPA